MHSRKAQLDFKPVDSAVLQFTPDWVKLLFPQLRQKKNVGKLAF